MTRLRSLLLRWVLIPTLTLWAIGFMVGYMRSLSQAHEGYDRALLGSALVIGERLTFTEGEVVAELPQAALEMLGNEAQDRIFYRIQELPGGRHITGYEDLPSPAEAPGSDPVFYDAIYKGQDIRVVALTQKVIGGGEQRRMLVQVAQTMDARRHLTHRIVAGAAALQLLLIAAAAALITFGVHRGLAPLKRLRDEVRARSVNDLTPVDTGAVPREVSPLIDAINAHTERQRQLGEAQARFVANASHQLKTPLTVLRAQVDHALSQTDVDAMRAVVSELQQTTDTTGRLVAQLLALARSEPGRALAVEDVDLTTLAREATFDLLTLARARGIDLGFEAVETVHVRGEPVLLRELVANLVHNAVTYTQESGKATVGVETCRGRARVRVVDNGPGIPVAERAKALERFYRIAGSQARGTGLGLSIVKEICDRHGIEFSFGEGMDGTGLSVDLFWPPGESFAPESGRACEGT
jgi:two-component system sensor histidine kinase TctE